VVGDKGADDMNSDATNGSENMDIEWKKTMDSNVGRFALEETSGTPHESPDETTYQVYLEVKEPAKEGELATMEWIDIGGLSLQYDTEASYTPHHGNTYHRSNRQYWCWLNVEFKGISMDQLPTDRAIEYTHSGYSRSKTHKHPRGYVHPSDAITAMFPADQFGTYLTAFKHFVKVVAPFVEQAMREDEGELFNPFTMETRLSYKQYGDKPLRPMLVQITDDEEMLRSIWDDSFKLLAGRILPVDSFILNHRDVHHRPQQPYVRIDQSVTQSFGMRSGVGLPPHCYTVITGYQESLCCEDCDTDWIEADMPERHIKNNVCVSCADERSLETPIEAPPIEAPPTTLEMIADYRNRILTGENSTLRWNDVVAELDKILEVVE